MKKITMLLAAVSVLTLASCASRGWSCTNRYCKSPEKQQLPKSAYKKQNSNADA